MNPKYNPEDLKEHYGVAAVIKNREGKILVQLHNKYGFWTLPVGKVDLDKSPEEGLKVELLEETGIAFKQSKRLIEKETIYERDGKDIKVKEILFEILDYKGTPRNKEPQKHKEQTFKSVQEIASLPYLSNQTLRYLELQGIKRDAKIA